MAKQISDKSGTVVSINRGKPGAGRKLKASADAAAKAERIMGGKSAAEAKAAAGPAPEIAATQPVNDAVSTERAPSFGANEPDQGVFLREVQKIRRQMEEVEKAKLLLKNEKGKLKDIRKLAAGVGLVMREVDESIDALNTEHVDLIAREERRRLYFEWLGLPLGAQPDLPGVPKATDTEADQAKWRKRGEIAGRLGEMRKQPGECPPHCVQEWLHGWEAGQAALMQGFVDANGGARAAAEVAPGGDDTVLTFTESHFQAGTELDEASLRTLLPGHKEAFHNAENVVVVFGDLKRIIKEPDAALPGGYYIDDGEEAEVTDPVPVTPVASDFA